uniref:Uncharacterized protein n=1 Tax=Oryza sativa subsp. japonica TaxID=39947 RepID=Q8S763_ORYSJ|nr:Hypothetical protein [Oryza sativa Japonica Group]
MQLLEISKFGWGFSSCNDSKFHDHACTGLCLVDGDERGGLPPTPPPLPSSSSPPVAAAATSLRLLLHRIWEDGGETPSPMHPPPPTGSYNIRAATAIALRSGASTGSWRREGRRRCPYTLRLPLVTATSAPPPPSAPSPPQLPGEERQYIRPAKVAYHQCVMELFSTKMGVIGSTYGL